jgi:hypothetical protein
MRVPVPVSMTMSLPLLLVTLQPEKTQFSGVSFSERFLAFSVGFEVVGTLKL